MFFYGRLSFLLIQFQPVSLSYLPELLYHQIFGVGKPTPTPRTKIFTTSPSMVLGSSYSVVFLAAARWLSNQIVDFLSSHVSLLTRRLAGCFAHPFRQSQGYASIRVPSDLCFPFFLSRFAPGLLSFRYGVVFLQGMLAVVDDLSLFIGYQLAHDHRLLAYLIWLCFANQEVVTIPVVSHTFPFAIAFPPPCGHWVV